MTVASSSFRDPESVAAEVRRIGQAAGLTESDIDKLGKRTIRYLHRVGAVLASEIEIVAREYIT